MAADWRICKIIGGGKISVQSSKLKVKSFPESNRAFFAKPVGQRALVVIAGVVMNFLLAVLIFYTFIFISGFKTKLLLPGFLADHKFFFVDQQNSSEIIINGVSKNSPAEKAGITPFSKIDAINGQKIEDSSQFTKIVSENILICVYVCSLQYKITKNICKNISTKYSSINISRSSLASRSLLSSSFTIREETVATFPY